MVGVLEAEPSLGSHLDPSSLLAAKREAFAPLLSLDRGKLDWEKIPMEAGHSLGMLVLEGMLSRRQDVGDLTFVELLGEGDLLRPWSAEESTTLASAASWRVMAPTRIALLDRDFALRTRHWPEIAAALLERSSLRSRALVITLAIHGAVRVRDRLLLTLWHLADRWGHVTPRGTVLPIALTHESLAQLIGARRSPVTVALGELRREELVRRERRGVWLLSGEPPLQIALRAGKAGG
ncbi:MAG TPA: helix-turn-helix domain-containing protein [Solirubrobacteraceae bacterium]|jgi:CRP-like cAMP-binding protein|nr:helix-turn-helix domain-containing protein [Solirubrobacteraceae bacterium]